MTHEGSKIHCPLFSERIGYTDRDTMLGHLRSAHEKEQRAKETEDTKRQKRILAKYQPEDGGPAQYLVEYD